MYPGGPAGDRISGVWPMANPREDTSSRSAVPESAREVFELPRTDGPSLKALNLPPVLRRRFGVTQRTVRRRSHYAAAVQARAMAW